MLRLNKFDLLPKIGGALGLVLAISYLTPVIVYLAAYLTHARIPDNPRYYDTYAITAFPYSGRGATK